MMQQPRPPRRRHGANFEAFSDVADDKVSDYRKLFPFEKLVEGSGSVSFGHKITLRLHHFSYHGYCRVLIAKQMTRLETQNRRCLLCIVAAPVLFRTVTHCFPLAADSAGTKLARRRIHDRCRRRRY